MKFIAAVAYIASIAAEVVFVASDVPPLSAQIDLDPPKQSPVTFRPGEGPSRKDVLKKCAMTNKAPSNIMTLLQDRTTINAADLHAIQCTVYCMLQKLSMYDTGRVDAEGIVREYSSDYDEETVRKAINSCLPKDIKNNNECEIGYELFVCFEDNGLVLKI